MTSPPTDDVLRCRLCRAPMQYVHGHAACLTSGCPLFRQNQAECCDGELCSEGWVPSSDAAAPRRAPLD